MNYRSILFIPGNNPGMLQNSDILGSDALFIDLEDAVALSEKDTARILVKEYLNTFQTETDIFIRINPLDSPYFYDDLEGTTEIINGETKIKRIQFNPSDEKSNKVSIPLLNPKSVYTIKVTDFNYCIEK